MSGSIEGQVINQANSQPIEGAELKVTGQAEATTTSGAKGAFKLANLEAGNYEMAVTNQGFLAGLYGPLVVVPETATELRIALEPKV